MWRLKLAVGVDNPSSTATRSVISEGLDLGSVARRDGVEVEQLLPTRDDRNAVRRVRDQCRVVVGVGLGLGRRRGRARPRLAAVGPGGLGRRRRVGGRRGGGRARGGRAAAARRRNVPLVRRSRSTTKMTAPAEVAAGISSEWPAGEMAHSYGTQFFTGCQMET